MTAESVPSGSALAKLTPDALRRPAVEGARMVSLYWLQQLQKARVDWARVARQARDEDSGAADGRRDEVDALHRARVAVRRLRASFKEHHVLLDGCRTGRMTQRLARVQRASNVSRDADVQQDWLEAEGENLPADARSQATAMRDRILEGDEGRRAKVSSALRKHFDPHVERFADRLGHWTFSRTIGDDVAPITFASHLADRIDRSATAIQREIATLTVLHPDNLPHALHVLRIHLKRQRALLAPHASFLRAGGSWYQMATQGQDLLGAMRDASLLAARARYHGADALANALTSVALGHQDAFMQGWAAEPTVILRAQRAAATELRSIAGAPDASALPLEIERKYLLSACPPAAAAATPLFIEQGWLPGTTLRERLRRVVPAAGATRFTRTIKLGPARSRIEVEEDTDEALFDALWPLTQGARIRKHRHVVRQGHLAWEIDVFLDRELVLAEVELTHEREEVDPPAWLTPYLVREVTGEPQYFNAVLARVVPDGTARH